MAQNLAQAANQTIPENVRKLLQCATFAPSAVLAYNSRVLYYINIAPNVVSFEHLLANVRVGQEMLQIILNKLELMGAVRTGLLQRVGFPDVKLYGATELSRWMGKEQVQAQLLEKIKDAAYITRIAEILGQPYGDFAEELAKAKAAEE